MGITMSTRQNAWSCCLNLGCYQWAYQSKIKERDRGYILQKLVACKTLQFQVSFRPGAFHSWCRPISHSVSFITFNWTSDAINRIWPHTSIGPTYDIVCWPTVQDSPSLTTTYVEKEFWSTEICVLNVVNALFSTTGLFYRPSTGLLHTRGQRWATRAHHRFSWIRRSFVSLSYLTFTWQNTCRPIPLSFRPTSNLAVTHVCDSAL